jgi:Zn-dependent peptidase ImmA (M78 family)
MALAVPDSPIDVSKVAEYFGFTILPYGLPDSTAGVMFIEDDLKVIGVNYHQPKVRQRFSVAHELGHYLLGHKEFDVGGTHVDEATPSYLDPELRQEREANEFAAELLMPAELLKRDVEKYGLDAARLARIYEVSEQALWIQLLDLKLA